MSLQKYLSVFAFPASINTLAFGKYSSRYSINFFQSILPFPIAKCKSSFKFLYNHRRAPTSRVVNILTLRVLNRGHSLFFRISIIYLPYSIAVITFRFIEGFIHHYNISPDHQFHLCFIVTIYFYKKYVSLFYIREGFI